ncbi:MAG: hypothetical protein IJI82_00980, partial [Clostridia bacterium]|nr:hypothetical protein [Clostridia bacterium]
SADEQLSFLLPLFLFKLKRKSGAKREMQEGVKLSCEKQYPFLSSFGQLFFQEKLRSFQSIPLFRNASERFPLEPS